jgi:hypothetical protein
VQVEVLHADLVDRPGQRVAPQAAGLQVELGLGEIGRDLEIGIEPQRRRGGRIGLAEFLLELFAHRRQAVLDLAPHELLRDPLQPA